MEIMDTHTCFSKAVGTRRRSSERLLLIRSRRRFSMICGRFPSGEKKPWSFTATGCGSKALINSYDRLREAL